MLTSRIQDKIADYAVFIYVGGTIEHLPAEENRQLRRTEAKEYVKKEIDFRIQ